MFENKVLRRYLNLRERQSVQDRLRHSRKMRWAWHVVHMREKRNACRIYVGKPE